MLLDRPVYWKASLVEELGNKAWVQLMEPSLHFKENIAARFSRLSASKAVRNTPWQELHSLFYAHQDFLITDTFLEQEVPIYTYVFSLNFINFNNPRGMWGTWKDLVHPEHKVAIWHHPHPKVTWGADYKALSWMRWRLSGGPVQNKPHPELSVPLGSMTSLLTWDAQNTLKRIL